MAEPSAPRERPGTDAADSAAARRARRRARRLTWAVRAGLTLLRALAPTWRRFEIGGEHLRALRARGVPIVFAFWHGRMLPLLWHFRNQGVHVLVSEHGDGEIIARVAEALGFRTVRGSTSRGAERALLGVIRVLREGGDVAFTPDGPRGPRETFAPGALIAAQRSGAEILLLAASASRARWLGSWDRFMIPAPFARVAITYAPPIALGGVSARDAAAQHELFGRRLTEVTAAGDRAVGVRAPT